MYAALPLPAVDEARTAKDIFTACDISAGLCVHIGCGREESPGLTAHLAAASRMLVHGICWDAASCARAREAVAAAKVAGRASVENITGGALPYVSFLCNLVVVEDMKITAEQGVGRDELMRVLAPHGKLCVRENGRWTVTVKPRPAGMDDWTHPHHSADGNMVSADRLLRFPIGLRWIGGIPRSINARCGLACPISKCGWTRPWTARWSARATAFTSWNAGRRPATLGFDSSGRAPGSCSPRIA
jgi:hypothetical protein